MNGSTLKIRWADPAVSANGMLLLLPAGAATMVAKRSSRIVRRRTAKGISWQGFSVVGGSAQKSPHSGKMEFLANQPPEEVKDEAYHTGSQ